MAEYKQPYDGGEEDIPARSVPVPEEEGGQPVPGQQAAGPAQGEAVPVNQRKRLAERLKSRHPDDDYDSADDDFILGRVNDDYEEDQKSLGSYKANEKKLVDAFNRDPRSARFLLQMADGGDPVVSLIKEYGSEIRDILDDPERQEDLAKANAEYVKRVAKDRELEEAYKENLDESIKMLDSIQERFGYSDDEIDQAVSILVGIAQDAIMGKFSEEALGLVLKALAYDGDMSDIAENSEIAGRNAKIEEKLRRPKEMTDGTPRLDGANNAPSPKSGSIFDLAKQAQ